MSGAAVRRAARHGKLLGVNEPFRRPLDTVIHENEGEYKDLRQKQDYITKVAPRRRKFPRPSTAA